VTDYEISVPVRRPWIALLLLLLVFPFQPFLLVIFLMGRGIVRPQSPAEFFSCLILGIPFFLVGFFVGKMWLWGILVSLFGQETLKLEEGHLMLRESFWGMGKWRSFSVDSIREMRGGRPDLQRYARDREGGQMKLAERLQLQRILAGIEGALRFLGIWPAVLFRAGAGITWFGLGMEESQGREILARLRMHLPESAFQDGREPS